MPEVAPALQQQQSQQKEEEKNLSEKKSGC